MSNDLVVSYSDEAERWGDDPYGRMIAETKARRERWRKLEIESIRQIAQSEAELQSLHENRERIKMMAMSERRRYGIPPRIIWEGPQIIYIGTNPPLNINGRPPIRRIIAIVAKRYDISIDDIVSTRRTSVVMLPRQIVMFLAKTLTLKSLPEIGRAIGGRDHTTALHGIRKITALIKTDEEIRAQVDSLIEELRSDQPAAAPAA